MTITVVIPVYNADRHLQRAIDSVLSQIEVDELILVDDGSSDRSVEICRSAVASNEIVKLLFHPGNVNKGASASRNLGIKHAKNNLIAFLDADDYYLPNRFKSTIERFALDKSIEAVYEMIGLYSEKGEINNYSAIERVNPDVLFENLQPVSNKVWFQIDGLTVKKIVFAKSGYFDESLKTSEDTLQWFKMASVCKMVPGNITSFVALSEKLSSGLSSNRIQVEKDFIVMLVKLYNFCCKQSLIDSRKELVLTNLFYFVFSAPYKEHYTRLEKANLFLKIIFIDPSFALFRSKSPMRYVGDFIGCNRILQFLQQKNNR